MNSNSSIEVDVQILEHFKGELPRYETEGASGLDVRAQLDRDMNVQPLERVIIPTGLKVAIPRGFELQVRPRSGWAIRDGLTVINSPGTIDSDYRGEIKIGLVNLGQNALVIRDQDRIAQLVLAPVLRISWARVSSLDETSRGAGGFGSTGK